MDHIETDTSYDLPLVEPRSVADLARAGMIVEAQGRTRLGDEFRISASRLQSVIKATVASGERGGNLLLVTSTRPAEGKSFSSINLAAALTQTSSRHVLLVDADSKPRCLSELLGIHRAPGLLDLAADFSIPPASLVVPTALPKLSILPLGTPAAAMRDMPDDVDRTPAARRSRRTALPQLSPRDDRTRYRASAVHQRPERARALGRADRHGG